MIQGSRLMGPASVWPKSLALGEHGLRLPHTLRRASRSGMMNGSQFGEPKSNLMNCPAFGAHKSDSMALPNHSLQSNKAYGLFRFSWVSSEGRTPATHLPLH